MRPHRISQLLEISLQQAFQTAAVAGFVMGHLMNEYNLPFNFLAIPRQFYQLFLNQQHYRIFLRKNIHFHKAAHNRSLS